MVRELIEHVYKQPDRVHSAEFSYIRMPPPTFPHPLHDLLVAHISEEIKGYSRTRRGESCDTSVLRIHTYAYYHIRMT
jgi:hypothetical protein